MASTAAEAAETAPDSGESMKIAIAMALLRSKLLSRSRPPPPSSASSSPHADALRWKQKAKERKQEIIRLRQDLKEAADNLRSDLYPQNASCKCYFFNDLERLSRKQLNDDSQSVQKFTDVLRRRFLRQVRLHGIIKKTTKNSTHRRGLAEFYREDDMEQLKLSADFLADLCDAPCPAKRPHFANQAHQAVEFILGSLSRALLMGKDLDMIEEVVNNLITHLVKRMCTLLEDELYDPETDTQVHIQHILRKLASVSYLGQRVLFSVSHRISELAERLLFLNPFDESFALIHDNMFLMIQLIEFLVTDYLISWSKEDGFNTSMFEEWVASFLDARKAVQLLERRSGIYAVYTDRVTGVRAKTQYYKWDVKYEFKSPDCVRKLAITINGMSPGPTITAEQGDTVVVEVMNGLFTENLAIHWHGIRQIGTPWYDGTEGVTQCPILPGETFVYKFVVDRAGTYMYHGHYGMQRVAGLHGLIQVSLPEGQSEPFAYDFDRSIILSDWYHSSVYEREVGLSSIPFSWVGEPQSLLIQGRGKYNCSLLNSAGKCNATSSDCSAFGLTVVPGKTYRLRVVSLTGLSALSFEIEGHNMTVVEADGHYVDPFEVQNLFIYSGESYSVLVTADQDPSRNYWITTNVVTRKPKTPTGLAIFNYYPNPPDKTPPTFPTSGPMWNDTTQMLAQSLAIQAREGYIEPPPSTPDRVLTFLNTQNKIDGGYYRWSINNISFTLPTTPYLVALKQEKLKERIDEVFDQTVLPDNYDWRNYDIYSVSDNVNSTSSNAIYRVEWNTTVDIVLQNANTMTPNNSETHPWHLHGHDFWVLGYGIGKFDPSNDPEKYNLVNPIKKNTVPVHPYGWTAIRFRADNPGVWLFHCHVEAHFMMGMGVVFEEGVDRVGELPSSIMGCGLTKSLIDPQFRLSYS